MAATDKKSEESRTLVDGCKGVNYLADNHLLAVVESVDWDDSGESVFMVGLYVHKETEAGHLTVDRAAPVTWLKRCPACGSVWASLGTAACG